MTIDHEFEARIWKDGIPLQDEKSLNEILMYLANRFAEFLGRKIEVADVNVESGVDGSCTVFVKSRSSSPIEMEWVCMIHMRMPEDFEEQRTQVYADLLAYSDGVRIGLQQNAGQSVMYVRYGTVDSSHGEWRHAKWREDEYGEWESYQSPAWSR